MKTGFFEESPDVFSIMRLCFFLSVVSMIALSFVIELIGEWNVYNSTLIAGVLSVSYWMKQRQHKNE